MGVGKEKGEFGHEKKRRPIQKKEKGGRADTGLERLKVADVGMPPEPGRKKKTRERERAVHRFCQL